MDVGSRSIPILITVADILIPRDFAPHSA